MLILMLLVINILKNPSYILYKMYKFKIIY